MSSDRDQNSEIVTVNEKKYVLYNMSHYGYLSAFLLHKDIYHKNEHAVLISSKLEAQTKEFLDKKGNKIPFFDKYFDYEINSNENLDENVMENKILLFFDKLFETNGYDINIFSQIYSGFDINHPFGVYLSLKGIKHNLFDISMVTSIPNVDHIVANTTMRRLLAKHNATSGYSPLVKKVIFTSADSLTGVKQNAEKFNLPVKERIPILDQEKIQFFTHKGAINKINRDSVETLKQFFDITFENEGGTTLLFMASKFFVEELRLDKKYEGIISAEDVFLYAYKIMLDYLFDFFGEKLISKPHPYVGIDKEKLSIAFQSRKYISGYVPAELLSLFDLNIHSVINVGSMAGVTVASKNSIFVPRMFFYYFEKMHSLHLALSIAKHIRSKTTAVNLNCVELSEYLPSNILIEGAPLKGIVSCTDEAECVIMDVNETTDVEKILNIYPDKHMIFFGSPQLLGNKVYKNMYTFKLGKKVQSPESVYDTDFEFIHVITKSEKAKTKLKSFKYANRLRYCRLETQAHIISPDEFILYMGDLSNKKQIDKIKESATSGNIYSQYTMAKKYANGHEIETNLDLAIEWMSNVAKFKEEYKQEYADIMVRRSSEGDLDVTNFKKINV